MQGEEGNVEVPRETIMTLVILYRVLVYPMYVPPRFPSSHLLIPHARFNFFHWSQFLRDIQNGRDAHDGAFRATLFAVCAVVSARLRDGALPDLPFLQDLLPPSYAQLLTTAPTPEWFKTRAESLLPKDILLASREFDNLRATALLALLCIQNGDTEQLQGYLGNYSTMMIVSGFYDEARWEETLSEVQRQERRRLVSAFIFGLRNPR